MPAVIRRARPADLDDLLPLFLGYLDFYAVAADEVQARHYLGAHLEAGSATVLLADLDGVGDPEDGAGGGPAGMAILYPTWDSLAMSRRWILHDLFVAPEARRQGVGRALIDACLSLARSTSATSVSLDTARDNQAAQALYEHTGFERDEVFVAYHHDLT